MSAPAKNTDLHGNVPDESPVALVLIDVINALEFEGSEELLPQALEAARRIAALKARAKRCKVPVIYVNDNFGRWRSDLGKLVAHCRRERCPGKPIVELLAPDEDDYFVLKPKHSGFFATALDTLLAYLRARVLVLAGLTGDRCVLFTASDAFLRDYILVVPSDCTASIDPDDNAHALRQMQRLLHADVRPSSDVDFGQLASFAAEASGARVLENPRPDPRS